MSKSVLVIDTPTCCADCPICFSRKISEDSYIDICQYPVYGIDITLSRIQNMESKPDLCPLKPLQEYKDLITCTTKEESTLDIIIRYAHDQGYNDCLYDIMKGVK